MTKPKLSIIIVNWNTKILLNNCLKSILDSQQPTTNPLRSPAKTRRGWRNETSKQQTIEIIVIDNGSSDGSVEMIKSLITDYQLLVTIRLIENKENLGFGKANNQGIKIAEGEYIMLLNSDTVVKTGAFNILINFLDKHPNTVISPQLLLQNGQPQDDYYMKFPNLWQIILYHDPTLRPLAVKLKATRSLLFNSSSGNSFPVDQLPGAALVAPKKIWKKVGYLDESYKFFFEDVDWSWKAMKCGVNRVVVTAAEIIHLGGASWKQKISNNKALIYQQYFSSMLLFCQKNYSYSKYQLIRWVVVINMAVTLKFVLAWYFIKTPTKQTSLW